MNTLYILRVAGIGACALVALQQFAQLGKEPVRRRARILVGVWSIYTALYLLARLMVNSAATPAEIVFASRFLDSVTYGLAPLGFLLVSTLIYKRSDAKITAGVIALCSLALLPWLGNLVVTDTIVTHDSWSGIHYRADTTWVFEASRALWFGLGAVAIAHMRRGRAQVVVRRQHASDMIALLLLVAGVNDSLLSKSIIVTTPLLDWACLSTVFILTYVMLDRTSHELDESRVEIRALKSMRSLIDALPIGILVFQDGQIIRSNNAACSFLGQTHEQLESAHLADFVEDASKAWITQLVQGVTLEPQRVIFGGKSGVGLLASIRIEFEGRKSTVVIVHDVGAQESMEKQLRLADRLSSLGTLAAGMAHEINNPLAYIMGNLEVLKEELAELLPPGDDPRRLEIFEMLGEIEFGSSRVREVVTGLRVFGRSEDANLGPVDVNRAIELAIALCQNEVRHVAELNVDLGTVPQIMGSEGQLSQVILNLLVNAAQARYAPEKRASISIRTRSSSSGKVIIEVQDNAEGLTRSELERVFDPFYTTKDVGKGTGLGLSICHGLVAKFGGSLELESEPGQGTLARIEIPEIAGLSDSSPKSHSISRSMPVITVGLAGRVLIVDDDPLVTRVIVRILAELDCTVVNSGKEALQRLQTDRDFDVELCDLMMPGISGADVYREAVNLRPSLAQRFVFLTGGAFSEEAVAFAEAHQDRVLSKPIDGQRLRARVQSVLREHQSRPNVLH